MSGYVPLFSSLTTGTLCGRWPDVGLWPIVLSLADRHGVVDVTVAYLSGVTGLPVTEVDACMSRFCEPDPHSRSGAENGARLRLIEPERRSWGWVVVNHGYYREKARKQMQQIDATQSGRDADRKRREREQRSTGDVRRRPAISGADRLSDSDSDKTTQNKTKKAVFDGRDVRGLNHEAWERWLRYRTEVGKPIKVPSLEAAARRLAKLGDRQAEAVESSIANGWTGLFEPNGAGNRAHCGSNGASHPEANARFDALIAHGGADRTPRDQQALEQIGGFTPIRMRTPFDEPRIRAEFVEAWLAAGGAPTGAQPPPAPRTQK